MTTTTPGPLSGRRAEAARNDHLILEAARAVFTADPAAPIAAVAERAGVGIGALYRRYRTKEELLQRLSLDGLNRYVAEVEAALADEGEPWGVFATFLHRALEAGAGSLTVRFAGSFTATDELRQAGQTAYQLTQQLLDRTKAAGVLRPDVEVTDVALLLEYLQAIKLRDQERTGQLRRRYLALLLDSLRLADAAPLPGPVPTWEDMSRRYEKQETASPTSDDNKPDRHEIFIELL
jgi:AcrR family transcriptional regulator